MEFKDRLNHFCDRLNEVEKAMSKQGEVVKSYAELHTEDPNTWSIASAVWNP
jgi:hypothetical protein